MYLSVIPLSFSATISDSVVANSVLATESLTTEEARNYQQVVNFNNALTRLRAQQKAERERILAEQRANALRLADLTYPFSQFLAGEDKAKATEVLEALTKDRKQ